MRNYLFIVMLALIASYGCQQKTGTQVTRLGNEFTLHTNSTEGIPAEIGNFAYVHVILRAEDSIVYSTRDVGAPPTAVQILPDTFSADQISPVEDALRGLHKGDSLTVMYRIDTLDRKPPGFENVDVIYYDIAVTDVVTEGEFNARREAEQAEMQAKMDEVLKREPEVLALVADLQGKYKAGTLENIQSTASGLQYVMLEEGTGTQAEAGKNVVVQYVGALAEDGSVFDQSFRLGKGISFPLGAGRVIRGWDEGIALLKEGGKALLIIPSDLGYGAGGTPDGRIPANAELLFYVDLEEVR